MTSGTKHTWSVAALAAAIFLLNLWVAWDLSTTPFNRNMQTNEGSFIAQARIFAAKPDFFTWWPFWNAGSPTVLAYPPGFPAVSAAFVALSGWPPALAYRFVTGLFYCLGAVSVFLAAYALSRSRWRSTLSALLYSLVAPCAFLAGPVRSEIGGFWNSRRLHAILFYGEVPHLASLAILPLVVAALHLAWVRRRPLYHVLAGAAIVATSLTNAFGAATVAAAVISLLLAESRELWRYAVGTLIPLAVGCYALCSPWFSPFYFSTVTMNSANIGARYGVTPQWLAGVLTSAIGYLLMAVLLQWKSKSLPLRFGVLFSYLFGVVTLTYYWAGYNILYQSHRYQHEFEAALCLLIPFVTPPLAPGRKLQIAAAAAVPLLALFQGYHLRRYVHSLATPIDITKTIEYRTAQYFKRNLGGRRVMASGSSSLWLNVFTDTPQLSGGHDPSALNFTQRVAVFTIYSGLNAGSRDAEISTLWLKAFGVHAVNVPGRDSTDFWKPYANPGKFEGVLPVLWRDGPDTIYEVPQRSPNLSHIIPSSAVVARKPVHGLDVDPLVPYVDAIEDPSLPVTGEQALDWGRLRIAGTFRPDDVLSVQINYHPGWRAEVDGHTRRVSADGLGLLVVHPECRGRCVVNLFFDGGTEQKVTEGLALAAIFGTILWLGVLVWRRPLL